MICKHALVRGLSISLPYLSISLQEEVLSIIKNTCDGQIQAVFLFPILSHLPKKLQEKVIAGILYLINVMKVIPSSKGDRLGNILPLRFIPQLVALGYIDTLMNKSLNVKDGWWRGELLAQIAVSLAERDQISAFTYIKQYNLGRKILLPPIPPPLSRKERELPASEIIKNLSLGEIGLQGWALAQIVVNLPVSMLNESLVISREIKDSR